MRLLLGHKSRKAFSALSFFANVCVYTHILINVHIAGLVFANFSHIHTSICFNEKFNASYFTEELELPRFVKVMSILISETKSHLNHKRINLKAVNK